MNSRKHRNGLLKAIIDKPEVAVDTMLDMQRTIRESEKKIKDFETRSLEYLEIYRRMNAELSYFRTKHPHPYDTELKEFIDETLTESDMA